MPQCLGVKILEFNYNFLHLSIKRNKLKKNLAFYVQSYHCKARLYDTCNLATINILVTDWRITVALVVLPVLTLLEETEIKFDTSGQEFMMLDMTF